ncbi:hypothetical protein [Robiginitalea biformata]|uniref:Uncharacterized protein n=1 Tax=Robiginitalea biformata (strain ATCC BAA-864 / DSM 15991 / KCTC 12146 / HTCC2501) TaxID=313596 RepID=A4CN55_ROBBH|nr:hypothetical protein [Robiginitalea biformata]EAR15097.1 hypothetical protein RB2501_12242 [Robiginitalea biformata HTCC2501]
MTTKIITLVVLFIASYWGLFALLATILNVPFKLIFGSNNKTGTKKLYWIGHLILVVIIFYVWQLITSNSPTLTLVLILLLSTLLSTIISKKERQLLAKDQINDSNRAKSAFIWNVILIYTIGLISGNFEFVWW